MYPWPLYSQLLTLKHCVPPLESDCTETWWKVGFCPLRSAQSILPLVQWDSAPCSAQLGFLSFDAPFRFLIRWSFSLPAASAASLGASWIFSSFGQWQRRPRPSILCISPPCPLRASGSAAARCLPGSPAGWPATNRGGCSRKGSIRCTTLTKWLRKWVLCLFGSLLACDGDCSRILANQLAALDENWRNWIF